MRNAIVLLIGWAAVGAAQASGGWDAMSIQVESTTGTATYLVNISNGSFSGDLSRLEWNLQSPVVLESNGQTLATIAAASYAFQFSPRAAVEMDFTILAGDEPLLVTAQSPVLSFPWFAPGTVAARTSVALTLTDGVDGFAEMLSANEPIGTGAFQARINGDSQSGLKLADLIYQMALQSDTPGQPAGTLSANGSFPNFGFATITGATVTEISNDLAFTLTPGDVLVVDGITELDQAVPGFSCPGDIDLDGVIDLADLTLMLESFGSCSTDSAYVIEADVNGDGCVDLADLADLLGLFGESC